jgi:hypothetical protein
MFSSLKKKKYIKMFGVLGIDKIEDEDTKLLLKHYSSLAGYSDKNNQNNSLQI